MVYYYTTIIHPFFDVFFSLVTPGQTSLWHQFSGIDLQVEAPEAPKIDPHLVRTRHRGSRDGLRCESKVVGFFSAKTRVLLLKKKGVNYHLPGWLFIYLLSSPFFFLTESWRICIFTSTNFGLLSSLFTAKCWKYSSFTNWFSVFFFPCLEVQDT